MGYASAIGAAVTVGGTVYQGIKAAKQKKEEREAIKNLQRQELKNVTEKLGVSTLGADLQRQEATRRRPVRSISLPILASCSTAPMEPPTLG